MTIETIKKILSAPIYDAVQETPIHQAPILSNRLGNKVLIKREDLQPVHSFKLRGAYNKILSLSRKEKEAGVIAASAGNHAQGVAFGAARLGINSVIVMPVTTPDIKVSSVSALGGRVVLHGDTFNEALAEARKMEEKEGYTFIHPYDDPVVIAGQGTIGMEIIRHCDELPDAVFVPVGGGGLLAGIAAYIKFLKPEVKVFGVESEDSACLKAAMEAGVPTLIPDVGIFADGVAVNRIGEKTFAMIKDNIDGVITVNTDEICAAIKDTYDETRSVSEPAGALALAGLKKYCQESGVKDQVLLTINSGANMNFDRLRHISERTEIGEKREAVFAVGIPEVPGAFKAFCAALEERSITEFNYRYSAKEGAVVFVGVQLQDPVRGRMNIRMNLEKQGYSVTDLSEDEIAKLHIRHLVGGRAPEIIGERIFSFEFPERPGALLDFLNSLGEGWNISLFHYRNHGAAYGRVLAGLQTGADNTDQFLHRLRNLGYSFEEHTDNEAYRLFLK